MGLCANYLGCKLEHISWYIHRKSELNKRHISITVGYKNEGPTSLRSLISGEK